jgi:hypothetical protein
MAKTNFSEFVQKKPSSTVERAPRKEADNAERLLLACRVNRVQWERIQRLCIDERTSIQAVLTEALDDWFKKRGLPW